LVGHPLRSSARRCDTSIDVENLAIDECGGGAQQKGDGIRHIVLVAESP
jgi:hypothetical protein